MPKPDVTNPTPLKIDEIPTQPCTRRAMVASLTSIVLGGLLVVLWHNLNSGMPAFLEGNFPAVDHFKNSLTEKLIPLVIDLFWVFGITLSVAGVLSLWRLKAAYLALPFVLLALYPIVLAFIVLVWTGVFTLVGDVVTLNGQELDRVSGILYWFKLSWLPLAIAAVAIVLHAMLWSRPVYAAFTKKTGPLMKGDMLLEDWRTHGKDPRARKSFYTSITTHLVILILIPFLLSLRGCVEGYKVPEGKGEPATMMVEVVQPKRKKKQTITVRPDSPILFDMEELPDEDEVMQQMEQLTTAQYEVNPNANAGNLGQGGPGEGGWPNGMEDYRVRFIRLNHGGAGWDDGMGNQRADINFLNAFAAQTGLTRIANDGESHTVGALDNYPEDAFPPFVYMTGNGAIGRLTTRDKEILREYCYNGGMLIGDAGHPRFGQDFRRLMNEIFGTPMVSIATDEMIFQLPNRFPNGPPPLWAHDGRQTMGIRRDGRWIVFYFPGDLNDAWKSPQYTDVTPEMREQAYALGVNLVYYAFTQWNNIMEERNR